MDKPGHIYLLREREFIRLDEPTYKIGKTTQSLRRFRGYPHDSHVLLVIEVENVTYTETKLIRLFKEEFDHKPNYGNEYFSGDSGEMKRLILITCCDFAEFVLIGKKTKTALEQKNKPIGIFTRLFQGLGLSHKPDLDKETPSIDDDFPESENQEPIKYFAKEPIPDTLSGAIDIFVRYITEICPEWYTPGVYIPSDDLLEEFIFITGYNVTLSALSKQLNGIIYDDKKRKKIHGRTMTTYRMININVAKLN